MDDERSDIEAGVPGSDEMPDAVESGTIESGTGAGASARPKRRMPKEIGGPAGPEPTRYGDWERKGIARDF